MSPSALQRLRGWDDVDTELSEMRLEEQSEKAEGHLTVLNLLSQRSLRWQLVSVIVMNMGQQLSGVNAVSHSSYPSTPSQLPSFPKIISTRKSANGGELFGVQLQEGTMLAITNHGSPKHAHTLPI